MSGSRTGSDPAGEDSTWPSSLLGDVPAFAVAWIDPDTHRPARCRVDEDLVAAPESRLDLRPDRFAATGACRRAAPVGRLGAIPDALDERADHERDADPDQPDASDRERRTLYRDEDEARQGQDQAKRQDEDPGEPESPAHSTGVVGAVDPSGVTTTA